MEKTTRNSLKEYNTFMVDAVARNIFIIHTPKGFLSNRELFATNFIILGQGSNVLFTKDFDGTVFINKILGKEMLSEDGDLVRVKVYSGENWHNFVSWTVGRNLWGVENLAYIPGTVGAAPVQNIGAYGVEVKDVIESVEVFDFEKNEILQIKHIDCDFGYRVSIFKKNPKKYFVISVTFLLKKKGAPNLSYTPLRDRFVDTTPNNPKVIFAAVIQIRKSKLPDVGSIGMAGSFFKNPVVGLATLEAIKAKYPTVKYFFAGENLFKISAGWIIEVLGYKGILEEGVGTYEKHALVLVNYGGATGEAVWNFAQKIVNEANDKMGVLLEPEVIII